MKFRVQISAILEWIKEGLHLKILTQISVFKIANASLNAEVNEIEFLGLSSLKDVI